MKKFSFLVIVSLNSCTFPVFTASINGANCVKPYCSKRDFFGICPSKIFTGIKNNKHNLFLKKKKVVKKYESITTSITSYFWDSFEYNVEMQIQDFCQPKCV